MNRRFLLLLGAILLTGLLVVGSSLFHKPYQATATLEIISTPLPDSISPQARISEMRSPSVIQPVIKTLKLDETWAQRYGTKGTSYSYEDASNHLGDVLMIKVVPGTSQLNVTAQSEMPREAADIANAIVDEYKARQDRQSAERFNQNVSVLIDQMSRQQEELVTLATSLQALWKKEENAGPASTVEIERIFEAGFGQSSDLASLCREIGSTEEDADNLLKDGFDKNLPRITALRAENDQRKNRLKDMLRAMFQRNDMTFSPALLQARHDFEQKLQLQDALQLRLRQMLDQGPPSSIRIISRATPSS
jgi:hypothetical protein